MFQLNPSVFGSITSKADYDRQKEQLKRQKQMQDLQTQLLQKQVGATEMDLPTILGKAQQVGFENLSPQEQQLIVGSDIAQMAKQTVDSYGNVITNRSYRDLLGMPAGQVGQMPPSVMQPPVEAPIDAVPLGVPEEVMNMPSTDPAINRNLAPIDTTGLSPYTVEDLRKTQLQEQIKLQAEQQKDISKTREGQQKISTLISQLKRVNNELAEMGGLKKSSDSVGNLPTMAAGVSPFGIEVGSTAESIVSPKVAQKREEFNSILKSLLPFYIAANNLPATMVDTEQGMERIMQSMGNPYGFAETNQKLLENAENLFGIQNKKSRRIFNPETGRLE